MMISSCVACCEMFYPWRETCPSCGSRELDHQAASGKGDVYSYTVIQEPPAGFKDQSPYTVALVHLVEGAYVTARLVDIDPAAIFIGMPLELAPQSGDMVAFRPRRNLVE